MIYASLKRDEEAVEALQHSLKQDVPPPLLTPLEVVFLTPLGIVSTRGRAAWLFDFEYLWEVYKPAAKRRWGYYTLPILYGDRLVARLDPKLERASSTLLINGFWPEDHAPVETPEFATALASGLARFAEFLDARRVNITRLQPTILRTRLQEHIGELLEQVGAA